MPDPTRPFWLSAFLDLPSGSWAAGVRFWAAVTGYRLSPPRGPDDEFATLLPPAGDDYLRVQRIGGPARLHLDVHVPEPDAAAQRAVRLGATLLNDPGLGYRILTSPGGLVFCLVSHPSGVRPASAMWPAGHRSQVDQVALDLPRDVHATEREFWAALLHADLRPLAGDEFSAIDRRPELPLRLLLHRLDESTGRTRAHLDLATDDRATEVRRHRELGAEVVGEHHQWTVLRDPAGLVYCVTDRRPA